MTGAVSCLSRASGILMMRSSAALQFRLPGGSSWLNVKPCQQRPVPQRLQVLSTAARPYWDDDTKSKLNVYADLGVYKGKAAMKLRVITPTWEQVGGGLRVKKAGVMLLELANSTGPRQYDWEKKENFGLSALECAKLLNITDSGQGGEFLHDPNMGGPDAGKIFKKLSVRPADNAGWFFGLSSNASGAEVRISCAVNEDELRLIKSLAQYLIPQLLGFHEHFQGPPNVVSDGAATYSNGRAVEGAPF